MSTSMTGLYVILTRASLTQELKQMRWLELATGRQSTKTCSVVTAAESMDAGS